MRYAIELRKRRDMLLTNALPAISTVGEIIKLTYQIGRFEQWK